MTREETVSLLLQLLPPAHPEIQHALQVVLLEILRKTSVANLLVLQYTLEDMKKGASE